MNRKISGGQRKRLNIALELMREPPILFLDEPTSGLSSRDSENIMDILKELTLMGKLVFVVIHQPSSAIFKTFDKVVVLDNGGYMIYNGKPIEAITYFKSAIREVDWSDSVCRFCGNVNSEQIFNIIETRVLDEFGNLTQMRKFSPEDWYYRFRKFDSENRKKKNYLVKELPKITFSIPSKLKQLKVFISRDVLTKLSNLQYILINLLETPLMALIFSFIIKFWKIDSEDGYQLFYNENLPVYIFMSVIIAVFVGLTVSAQEIYKDKKILSREKFLNLSRGSYLFSKIIILAVISAYQSLVFVLVGNSIIEITFLNFYYWIILFSIWFSANIMGLIVSDSFKSSVNIYIVIPFLIIPQIILSGVLVPFNKLNPQISKPNTIPWYGEIMSARWAYEALAVKQYKENPFMKNKFEYEKIIYEADYVKDYWCSNMDQKARDYLKYKDDTNNVERAKNNILLLKNEFSKNHSWTKKLRYQFNINDLEYGKANEAVIDSVLMYIKNIKIYNIIIRNKVNRRKNAYIDKFNSNKSDDMELANLRLIYFNEKLESFVTNNGSKQIVEYDNSF
ncbi:MAG: ABC transporter permease, partial [Bacteroidota bacterium]|nr:ABC transporter permease [Bacteroidota bacterium]